MENKFEINCCPWEHYNSITDNLKNAPHYSKYVDPILLYDSKTDTLCIYCPECGRSQVGIKNEAIKNWNYETSIADPYVLKLEARLIEDVANVNILTTPKNVWVNYQMSACAMCKSMPEFKFDTTSVLDTSSVKITAVCPKCGLIAGHFIADLTRGIEISEGIIQVTDTWNALQKSLNSVEIGRKDDV